MTDRELLEFAAKAAGLVLLVVPNVNQNDFDWWAYATNAKPNTAKPWDPLEDDGDALRLAVKLAIDVQLFGTVGWRPVGERPWMRALVDRLGKGFREDVISDDPYAATRRAIVKAAAEIGSSMK